MYYYLAILNALESFHSSPVAIERLRKRWVEALKGNEWYDRNKTNS